MPPDEWTQRTADDIGRRVRHYRSQLGLSVQQLSDAVEKLGVSIQRPVLSNLENGRRHTISGAEIMALAKVLGVHPIQLVFPVGDSPTVEVLPGQVVDTWRATKWFTGESPFPGDDNDEDHAASAVALYRQHEQAVDGWRSRRRLRSDDPEIMANLLEGAIGPVRDVRQALRKARYLLPELPPELAYLNDDTEHKEGSDDGSTENPADSGR